MKKTFLTTAFILCVATSANAAEGNKFLQTNFVANKAKYAPQYAQDDNFINAWGIAIRPKGAGGHFWVLAKDVSYEYVGDVTASTDETLRPLHQDKLTAVKLPVGGEDNVATGVVFSDSKDNFVITQNIAGIEPITAPAKFLFASDGGIISAWTERKHEDGTFDRSGTALKVIDESENGAQFFGVAISHNYDRLYAANFGAVPAVEVYDGNFERADIQFDQPFDENKNGQVDPGEYAPFNVQSFATPAGENHVLVTYAKTQACPAEEVTKGSCEEGALFAGEEDTAVAGSGRVAEFTEDGKLVAAWNDGGKLSAPWGLAFAPANFGKLSNALLVANFGDGSIAAYDSKTHNFIDVARDTKGKPLNVDKIWGLLFGNGESLGDANTLYFTAGPEDETDGVFGKLTLAKK